MIACNHLESMAAISRSPNEPNRIPIVVDGPEIAEMVAAMFCDHGFDVSVASSARGTDLILQDSTFDFVLLNFIDLVLRKLGVGSTITGSGLKGMKVQSQVTGVQMLHRVLTSDSRKQSPSSRDSRPAA
jgi:hypothetical protein